MYFIILNGNPNPKHEYDELEKVLADYNDFKKHYSEDDITVISGNDITSKIQRLIQ
jgi:hypothetical protein